MLRVTTKHKENQIAQKGEDFTNPDIIVEKSLEIENVRDDGVKEISLKTAKVNLTKKINETVKLYKQDLAEEKLAEIERIFSK